MNKTEIVDKKAEIITKFGDWTSHNVKLHEGIFTLGDGIRGDEAKIASIKQIVADVANKPLNQLRILDLACLEGGYAVEFALEGAEVVAIEGREANIIKANFAKEVLNLTNLTFYQDDVLNLTPEKYGYFDVVLCLGILYHLDVPDVFHFIENIFKVCKSFAVFDTHISYRSTARADYKGNQYWGNIVLEHKTQDDETIKSRRLLSSLHNLNSIWFTRPSLYNLLANVGFSSVYEKHNPPLINRTIDRVTLVAVKGETKKLKTAPQFDPTTLPSWTKDEQRKPHLSQHWFIQNKFLYNLGLNLPQPIKKILKRFSR
jgi:2-polyprenyl-3-methyl-5-hydroxy-6-metoxy-1,4-benzoquinol methylase